MDQGWQAIALALITTGGTVATAYFSRRARRDAKETRKDRLLVQAISLRPTAPPSIHEMESAPPTPRDPSVGRPHR
jgi:hypothetical protein